MNMNTKKNGAIALLNVIVIFPRDNYPRGNRLICKFPREGVLRRRRMARGRGLRVGQICEVAARKIAHLGRGK